MKNIDFDVVVPKLEGILARGLSLGLGTAGEQVCVEAAVCEALGLPHSDDPKCVAPDVRVFKIALNDSRRWLSPKSRAKGLHDLAIAQLGTKSMKGFAPRLTDKVIRVL